MQDNENITNAMEDEDIMLPEGYTGAEGEDLFDEGGWGGQSGTDAGSQGAKVPGQEPAQPQPPAQDPPPAEEGAPAPATGQDAPTGDGGAAAPGAPATEPKGDATPKKFKFKARVDRQDLDVEVDENDLPTLYEKAQGLDRARAKEVQTASRLTMAEEAAKRAGFDGLDSLLESVTKTRQEAEVKRLTMEGVHEDVAKDMAARRFAAPQGQAATPPAEAPVSAAAQRDFRVEAAELMELRPDLVGKALPEDVLRDCGRGKPLVAAYYEYEARQAKAEAGRLRQENEIMKRNAANAARAPVTGTQGGGVNNRPEDDFLRGFYADY